MNKRVIFFIFTLILVLIISNGYWVLELKDLKIEKEIESRKLAEQYIKKVEYQHELTKKAIETVTEETNLYMNLNEQLQGEYNALQKDIDALLKNDECGNSNIADDVRNRLYSTN